MTDKLLEMRDIRKRFGATHALRGMNLSVGAGEVLALLGENGAGKSTLINILGGIVQPDSGTIVIDGRSVNSLQDVQAARQAGIAVIHQEIVLVPHLSVAENIFLGREPATRLGFRDRAAINRLAQDAIDLLRHRARREAAGAPAVDGPAADGRDRQGGFSRTHASS